MFCPDCKINLIVILVQTFKQLVVKLCFYGAHSQVFSIQSLVRVVEGSSAVQKIFSPGATPETKSTRFP